MVGTQTLATVIPDCLEPDPANCLMPCVVGVLGAFALFLDTGPVLLHVQVDRTPTPQRAMATMAWSGFGFSGTPPTEPTPLVALSKSAAPIRLVE